MQSQVNLLGTGLAVTATGPAVNHASGGPLSYRGEPVDGDRPVVRLGINRPYGHELEAVLLQHSARRGVLGFGADQQPGPGDAPADLGDEGGDQPRAQAAPDT